MSDQDTRKRLAGWGVAVQGLAEFDRRPSGQNITFVFITSNTFLDDLFTGYVVSDGDNHPQRTFSAPLDRDFFTELEGKGCKVLIHSEKHPIPEIADGSIYQGKEYLDRAVIFCGVHRRQDIEDVPLPSMGSAEGAHFFLGWGCGKKELMEAWGWLVDHVEACS